MDYDIFQPENRIYICNKKLHSLKDTVNSETVETRIKLESARCLYDSVHVGRIERRISNHSFSRQVQWSSNAKSTWWISDECRWRWLSTKGAQTEQFSRIYVGSGI